jgi:hypothetical protein
MTKFNLQGSERKPLVKAIEELTGRKGKYCMGGDMKYAFDFGYGLELHRDGTLKGETAELIAQLADKGFTAEIDEAETYAEREMKRMEVEEQNVLDHSNEGQDAQYEPESEIPEDWENGMTEREELGLGKERSEDPQGENGMQASDVPEWFTYQAELSDPDCPDRMEVFSAENDEDAMLQAYGFCEGEVLLLELKQLDDNYNFIRGGEITPRTDRLTIEGPLDGFTPEKLDNLAKMVNAKAPLLKAALGTDDLPIKQTADTLLFPWFRGDGAIDGDHADAYAALVSLLCKAAREKKRVTAKEKDVDGSPKYAMRCFLLSLGFIGEEYKKARKILLSRLEGNSSWKNGRKAEPETEVADSE